MTTCNYCDELTNGSRYGSEVLYESEHVVVLPSLGQIIEGYLLIIPKEHVINMTILPKEWYGELADVYAKVREVLTSSYNTPLFFEHGPVSESKKGGCCVDHAHLHAVPLGEDIIDDIQESFSPVEITTLDELRERERGKRRIFITSPR